MNSPCEAQHILLTAFARSVQCAGHKEPCVADKPTGDLAAKFAKFAISRSAMLWRSWEVDFELGDPGTESGRDA